MFNRPAIQAFALLTLLFITRSVIAQSPTALHDVSTPVTKPGSAFGKENHAEGLKIGPTMDVSVVGEYIYAVGQGELRILDNAKSGSPQVVSRLKGLGNTRQIAVSRGHAFITAREEGLFIVDCHQPESPKLVYHYDTAELATAIAVSGDLAAVGNRFAGIELLDVSNPSDPQYLTTIRCGEVQSLVFHGDWLYAGTWSEKALAIINVSQPSKPELVKTIPLDGKGDGLDVSGNLLAIATGHHARSKTSPKPGDEAFGRGHGIEFYDISNPADPKRLSTVKFPPFYRIGMDMWGVVLASGHAFVNDTHNGFFLIDVHDPTLPRCIGWSQLPIVRGDPSPVAGLAVSNDRVFLAGGFDDLHLVKTDVSITEPSASGQELRIANKIHTKPRHGLPAYIVNGSVRSVVPWKDDLLLVAAGSAGWHVVRQQENGFEGVAEYPTRGFARDVAVQADRIFVAESLGGLSIWETQATGEIKKVQDYAVPGKSITQVVPADDGRIAFLAVGPNNLHIIRIAADGSIQRIIDETPKSGLFYREPFSPLTSDGKRILVQWHTIGLHEYIIDAVSVQRSGWIYPHQMDTECGAAPDGENWVATSRRGFFNLNNAETRAPEVLGLHRHEGKPLPGKPSLFGDKLFIADPFLGEVSCLAKNADGSFDVRAQLQLAGHPGRVKFCNGKALIPAGRDGLLMWRLDAQAQANANVLSISLGDEIDVGRTLDSEPLNQYQVDLRCHPHDPSKLVISAKNGFEAHTLAFLSSDAGKTWSVARQERSGDPDCVFDNDGRAFWSYMDKPTGGRLGIRRADNDREPWSAGKLVTAECVDKPHLAVDRTKGPHAGTIYLVGREIGKPVVNVSRSADGGETWQTTRVDVGPEIGEGFIDAPPTILPDGMLVIFVRSKNNITTDASGQYAGNRTTMHLLRSSDGGRTFEKPIFIRDSRSYPNQGVGAAMGTTAGAGTFKSSTRLYHVQSTPRPGAPSELEIVTSDDNGLTWSKPRPVPGTSDRGRGAGAASLTVNRDGVIGIQYFSMTSREFDVMFTASIDGGETFTEPVRVTSVTSTLPPYGIKQPRPLGGDQVWGDVAADGAFWLVWTDHRHDTGDYRIFVRRAVVDMKVVP